MRVLLLLNDYNDDIRGTMVYRLCQRLSPLRELSLTAIALRGGPLQKAFSSIGVGTMTIPEGKAEDKRYLRSEADRLFHRKDRPDIVQCHCRWPGAEARAFHHGDERIPLVMTIHDIRELDSGGGVAGLLSGFQERRSRKQVAVFVTNSKAMTARLKGHGVTEGQIRQIPFGVDAVQCFPLSTASRARFRSLMSVPERAPLLLGSGHFIEQNGYQDLVEAMPAVLRDHPEANLFLIGEGPDRDALKGRIEALGISGSIRLVRPVPEILPKLMSAADVVVLPHRTASNPCCLQQASAVGTPVVATRTGANPEVVVDGETGLMIEPGNVAEMASAISKLLAHDDAREVMGKAAREFILDNFEVGQTADRLIELWRELAPEALWQATDTIPLDELSRIGESQEKNAKLPEVSNG